MPSAGRNLAKLLGANKKVTLRGGDSDFNVDFDSDVAKLASLEATVKAQLDSDSGVIQNLRTEVQTIKSRLDSDDSKIQSLGTQISAGLLNLADSDLIINQLTAKISSVITNLDSDSVAIQNVQGQIDTIKTRLDSDESNPVNSKTLDMGSNDIVTTGKLYFANMFSTEGDLPSATTYHGMFAHATGAGYFAHGGSWIKLANNTDIDTLKSRLDSDDTFVQSLQTQIDIIKGRLDSDDAAIQTAASSGGGGGASVSISDSAPSSPSAGDLWFDSSEGIMYIYYNDGDSSQWVGVSGYSTNQGFDSDQIVSIVNENVSNGSFTLSGLSDVTVTNRNPTFFENVSNVGHLWINDSDGTIYVCVDNTDSDNIWKSSGLDDSYIIRKGPQVESTATKTINGTNGTALTYSIAQDFIDGSSFSYSLDSGSNLPSGLSISGTNITGTPDSDGTFTFTIIATDSNNQTGDKNYSLVLAQPSFTASGGTEYTSGGYKYHKFTSSGSLSVTGSKSGVEVLMIAGGGGGGRDGYTGGRGAGGGGAGGLVDTQTVTINSNLTITIGAGGTNTGSASSGPAGTQGNNTTVTGAASTLTTAIGGGGGGSHSSCCNLNNDTSGGSGGGATNGQSGSAGTSGQGNAGGDGGTSPYGGGGGGGKGAAGDNGYGAGGSGAGGDGTSSYSAWGLATNSGENISGTVWFAGGGTGTGGGVSSNTHTGGKGGGAGAPSGNGTANTGGGGAGNIMNTSGGSGGSGLVIIRYST